MSFDRSRGGGRAFFLSYASQDADAARKICEAMRATGIEVWLDQNELRGGGGWDSRCAHGFEFRFLGLELESSESHACE